MKSGFSVAMRTGASWAEAFFFFLTKDEKRRLYLNRVKPFEVAQKKTTLWANKSFSLLSNRFFLAWVTNVSARVNARTLEREQKIKRKIEEGGGDRRKPSFSPPPSLPNFFVLEIGSRKGLLRLLGFSWCEYPFIDEPMVISEATVPSARLLCPGWKLYPGNMQRMLNKDLSRFMQSLFRVCQNRPCHSFRRHLDE